MRENSKFIDDGDGRRFVSREGESIFRISVYSSEDQPTAPSMIEGV